MGELELNELVYIAKHNQALQDWARANGLNPTQMAAAKPIVIKRDGLFSWIRYHRFVLTAEGRMQINDEGTEALTVEERVPLKVDLPDELREMAELLTGEGQ